MLVKFSLDRVEQLSVQNDGLRAWTDLTLEYDLPHVEAVAKQSGELMMFLEPFKVAAAEGAVVELKLRLLAGKIPALQRYAHQKKLEDIEAELAKHFDGSLSAEEKETLRLCRQLRNKVLHTDFCAARGKLNELGVETPSGEVRKIDIPVVSIAEISRRQGFAPAATRGSPGEQGVDLLARRFENANAASCCKV